MMISVLGSGKRVSRSRSKMPLPVQVLCLGRVARLPLVVFAHVDEHRLWIGREPGLGVRDADLLDPLLRVVDQPEKSR